MSNTYTKAECITNGLIYLMQEFGRENVRIDAQHDVLNAGVDCLRSEPPKEKEALATAKMEEFGWFNDEEEGDEPFSWAIFT